MLLLVSLYIEDNQINWSKSKEDFLKSFYWFDCYPAFAWQTILVVWHEETFKDNTFVGTNRSP